MKIAAIATVLPPYSILRVVILLQIASGSIAMAMPTSRMPAAVIIRAVYQSSAKIT